jgi:DNA helicase-2/ATP-dependent DNA helicase PcrA
VLMQDESEAFLSHRIVEEEQTLLSGVLTLLEEEPYTVPPSEKELVQDLLRLRSDIANAKDEDRGSMLAQYNAQHSLLEQLRFSRANLEDVDPDCPYFAHLKLEEDGKTRDILLGKATRIQRGVRIVDWRNAPISQLFYRYRQGDVYEEEFAERERIGTILARRTLSIVRKSLVRIDSPEGTFVQNTHQDWTRKDQPTPRLAGGQGATLQAYGPGSGHERRMGPHVSGRPQRADKRLPDIAGLIDEDQFDLITRPNSGFVVIRGTAGSGKTTVALHRIAWLAYQDPSLDSPQTLVLVFSPGLRDYVSHVLPALGVENVAVQDYRGWARRTCQRHYPKLPREIRSGAPPAVMRLKLHPAMLQALEEQVADVPASRTPYQAIDDWISVLTHPNLLKRILDRMDPHAFRDDELMRATDWCRDRTEEVIAWMEGDREVDAALDVEDDALLLRAWQLRVGPLRGKKNQPLRYRHVALDEVQDFSPLEVRVLLDTLSAQQSITLAGDTQQHVMKEAGFTSWSDFFGHLGIEGTAVNTLRVSYRSSEQTVAFALDLLGELREDDTPPMVTRSGPPVELFQFTDHGACVAFLADVLCDLMNQEPLASVVLLCPDHHTSALYMDGLKRSDVPYLKRVTSQNFSFTAGIEITEVDQVKGLEFDYVVLIDTTAKSYPDRPDARRLLHVAATRAVHQLWLTCVGSLSPVVREALEQMTPDS